MIEIYGKKDCPFCVKAVNLATERGLSYVYKDVGADPELKAELLERFPEAKTVPQIFDRDYHVGGYDDFVDYDPALVFREDRLQQALDDILYLVNDTKNSYEEMRAGVNFYYDRAKDG